MELPEFLGIDRTCDGILSTGQPQSSLPRIEGRRLEDQVAWAELEKRMRQLEERLLVIERVVLLVIERVGKHFNDLALEMEMSRLREVCPQMNSVPRLDETGTNNYNNEVSTSDQVVRTQLYDLSVAVDQLSQKINDHVTNGKAIEEYLEKRFNDHILDLILQQRSELDASIDGKIRHFVYARASQDQKSESPDDWKQHGHEDEPKSHVGHGNVANYHCIGHDADAEQLQQQRAKYHAEQGVLQTVVDDLRAEVFLEIEKLRLELGARSANTGNLAAATMEDQNIKADFGSLSVKEVAEGMVQHDLACIGAEGEVMTTSHMNVSEGVDAWSFERSCWDAAVFLGDSDVHIPMESICIASLLLVCICLQFGFTCVVWNSLGNSSFDDETIMGYHWWRTDIGHSVNYMDHLTMETLVSRVCRSDSSLHLSQAQSEMVANINTFLDENKPFNGPLMCVLAMITWILTVFREFRHLIQMVFAFSNLPAGKTVLRLTSHGMLEVISLSRTRLSLLMLLISVRTCIAGTLLIAGLRFIFTDASIADMLLNAVALEFILCSDKLLYETLAPSRTRLLISLLEPVEVRRVKACGGLDVIDILPVVATIISTVFSYQLGCAPELSKMDEARHELCGGVRSFSYSVSAGGFVQWAGGLRDDYSEQTLDNLKKSSRYKLLRGLIAGSNSETASLFQVTLNALQRDVALTIVDVGEKKNAKCHDKLMSSFYVHADQTARTTAHFALRDAISNQSISTCHEVEKYCDVYQEQSGIAARLFCPQTCGCQSPQTALIYLDPSQGCPSACSSTASYLEALNSAPCVDIANDSQNMLAAYATQLQIAVSVRPRGLKERVTKLSEALLLHGCQAEGIEYMCDLSDLKGLSFFCPVRCRCNVSRHKLCPSTC